MTTPHSPLAELRSQLQETLRTQPQVRCTRADSHERAVRYATLEAVARHILQRRLGDDVEAAVTFVIRNVLLENA